MLNNELNMLPVLYCIQS